MRIRSIVVSGVLVAAISVAGLPVPARAANEFKDGAAQFARGRLAEAEATFARVVSARPRYQPGWLWLGVVQFYHGHFAKAEGSLARAAFLAPADGVALLWWGHALVRTNQEGRAMGAFKQAAAIPGNRVVREMATQALRALGPMPLEAAPPLNASQMDVPSGLRAQAAPAWVRDVDSYRTIAQFYNPRLRYDEADRIGMTLLGYSWQFNLDPRLVVALIIIESGFQPQVRSRVGAIGLGQLMPGTARALRVDPWDPVQNLYGSIRYLRGNLDQFGWQNVHLALAAYNAGRGAVERYEGIPPYAETQWYVANVTSLYRRFLSISGEIRELRRRLAED